MKHNTFQWKGWQESLTANGKEGTNTPTGHRCLCCLYREISDYQELFNIANKSLTRSTSKCLLSMGCWAHGCSQQSSNWKLVAHFNSEQQQPLEEVTKEGDEFSITLSHLSLRKTWTARLSSVCLGEIYGLLTTQTIITITSKWLKHLGSQISLSCKEM